MNIQGRRGPEGEGDRWGRGPWGRSGRWDCAEGSGHTVSSGQVCLSEGLEPRVRAGFRAALRRAGWAPSCPARTRRLTLGPCHQHSHDPRLAACLASTPANHADLPPTSTCWELTEVSIPGQAPAQVIFRPLGGCWAADPSRGPERGQLGWAVCPAQPGGLGGALGHRLLPVGLSLGPCPSVHSCWSAGGTGSGHGSRGD